MLRVRCCGESLAQRATAGRDNKCLRLVGRPRYTLARRLNSFSVRPRCWRKSLATAASLSARSFDTLTFSRLASFTNTVFADCFDSFAGIATSSTSDRFDTIVTRHECLHIVHRQVVRFARPCVRPRAASAAHFPPWRASSQPCRSTSCHSCLTTVGYQHQSDKGR